jgi:3-hydroxybutyryl-CoA dehydrogenase
MRVVSITRTPESGKRDLELLLGELEGRARKGRITQEQLASMSANIELASDLSRFSDVPMVIEAVYEDEEVKEKLYRALEPMLPKDAILATNTSSLSVNELSKSLKDPSRFVGLHFFNPAEVMKLVEVRRCGSTSDKAVAYAKGIVESLGKTPIMTPDLPGLYVNRILFPMLLESISVLETTKSPIKEIDEVMKLGANLPMGPLELCDFIGNDIVLNISNVLLAHTGDQRFKPPKLLERMVAEGKLGRKVGRGFYEYSK